MFVIMDNAIGFSETRQSADKLWCSGSQIVSHRKTETNLFDGAS